jgi:hypothetical protein
MPITAAFLKSPALEQIKYQAPFILLLKKRLGGSCRANAHAHGLIEPGHSARGSCQGSLGLIAKRNFNLTYFFSFRLCNFSFRLCKDLSESGRTRSSRLIRQNSHIVIEKRLVIHWAICDDEK